MRKEVKWFAEQMEKILKENDGKDHWSSYSLGHLFGLLNEEVGELESSIPSNDGLLTPRALDEIIKECGDVSNFSMMIADNAKRLKAKRLIEKENQRETKTKLTHKR